MKVFESRSFTSGHAVEDSLQNKIMAKQKNYALGEKKIVYSPLVDRRKLILPSLHVKLCFVKKFVKAVDKDGEGFKYLRGKFPQLLIAIDMKTVPKLKMRF
ncbi:hypothetical protein PR048_026364 [Dryococelus australis]|uniref:Uncharacterized protein n=1 Tax=Dryococelus australis TaxID=614101 RepID=A0ABQ9GL45_9NEOP|nr:hypothetical protein PR048_026364 [Dryococelus australis]